MQTPWPAIERIIEAEQLRRFSDLSKAKDKIGKEDTLLRERELLEQEKRNFIQSEYLEKEFDNLEFRILDAAKHGEYEVEVMKFFAAFCTDGGRAINNSENDWPETLQGKAMSFHAIWKQYGQPNGYHLKAKIITFPNGLPGDVSLSIAWS